MKDGMELSVMSSLVVSTLIMSSLGSAWGGNVLSCMKRK